MWHKAVCFHTENSSTISVKLPVKNPYKFAPGTPILGMSTSFLSIYIDVLTSKEIFAKRVFALLSRLCFNELL